ncbi:MAG: DUF362 domain-containing protein [Candidatus Eisenbacteria bacterium]|nr:DUF362 domain-containing protein [Candidatus Eisenbacteria bacterium]
MPKVAVLKTNPDSVIQDYGRLLELAEFKKAISPDKTTHLKINISWHKFYPACSTTPWQLDAVIGKLLSSGFEKQKLLATQNDTVVVSAREGAIGNRLDPVVKKYGIDYLYLNDPDSEWVKFEPKEKMLVLDKIYPEGIEIPRAFFDTNIIHFPTMKTHVFTTMTGAVKNAFGGLLHKKRHWTHSVIHEALVDLLAIQKEIHSGVFCVMDAAFSGDGPGPRAMKPHVTNLILASSDPVALDTVAAKIMGFEPSSIDFIRIANEKGFGCGDLKKIEVVGTDISQMNLHFKGSEETFASRGQKLIYHGALKPLEKLLLRTPIVPWSYLASRLYHDVYWYNVFGRSRVKKMLKTDWGKLFLSYPGTSSSGRSGQTR